MILNEEDMINAIISKGVWNKLPATKKILIYDKLEDIKKIVKSEVSFLFN